MTLAAKNCQPRELQEGRLSRKRADPTRLDQDRRGGGLGGRVCASMPVGGHPGAKLLWSLPALNHKKIATGALASPVFLSELRKLRDLRG
jgi:hypothetical protein